MNNNHPDYLRNTETVCAPDARNKDFVVFDENGERPLNIDDHYMAVEKLKLNGKVPEEIVIQFETTKNLFLYSWYVYRFFPVARQHALTVLEFALRERLENEIPQDSSYRGRDGRLYLKSMLRYCRDEELLQDRKFEVVQESARSRAIQRRSKEVIQVMISNGLEEMPFDETDVEIEEGDWGSGYVDDLVKGIPFMRNAHAHGSKMLDNQALGTMHTVMEIINQLWLK